MQNGDWLSQILSEAIDQSSDIIAYCTVQDYHITAQQVVVFGLVDKLFIQEPE